MRLPAGSHGVGKALDAELAQLGPRAGLTSAQTDGVIPASRDRTFPRGSRSPKAEIRPSPLPPLLGPSRRKEDKKSVKNRKKHKKLTETTPGVLPSDVVLVMFVSDPKWTGWWFLPRWSAAMIISDEQREEHYQEYLRLLHDSNYSDVSFDEQSGGISAIHREHKFDSEIGAFGIKIGDYERITVDILRKRGHCITLESELAPNGVKTPDGFLDGIIMDIKSIDGFGKWAVKDKLHNATKQGVECVILYFHKKQLFSYGRIEDGWNKFMEDKDSQRYDPTIKRVICIVEYEALEWDIPQ